MLLSFAPMSGLGDFYDDVYWSYDMYILEMYEFYPLRLLRNFIYACYLNLMCRRGVYFLNIYIIRVYYRFNINKALHNISLDHAWNGIFFLCIYSYHAKMEGFWREDVCLNLDLNSLIINEILNI